MQKIQVWLKDRRILTGVVVVVFIIVGALIRDSNGTADIETAQVVLGTVTQGISVTCKVIPTDEARLGFEGTGRVSQVPVDTGDQVFLGQTLVALDAGDAYAKLLQAEAELETEQAELAALKKGARPEELAVSEVKVANATVSLDDAKQTLINAVTDGYTKSDDAVRNKVDQFMLNPRSQNPRLNVNADPQLAIDIEANRKNLEGILVEWQVSVAGLSSGATLSASVDIGQKNLSLVLAFLEKVSLVVNALTPSSSLSSATISDYKSDVLTARSNINTAITTLATAKEKLRSAESSLLLAEKNLILDRAGATTEDVLAQQAKVKSAEANVINYQNQLEKTVIRAPFSGIVTIQNGRIGQIATPGAVVVAVSGSELIIEAFVPEVDIAQVAVGNTALVTLDAYGSNTVFDATIFSIDPAETITDGISTYKIKLRFQKPDGRIRSGMTANIDATTVRKEQVLSIPIRAVTTDMGKKLVTVVADSKTTIREVSLGIRGAQGTVEVLGGLSLGETVVLSPKK